MNTNTISRNMPMAIRIAYSGWAISDLAVERATAASLGRAARWNRYSEKDRRHADGHDRHEHHLGRRDATDRGDLQPGLRRALVLGVEPGDDRLAEGRCAALLATPRFHFAGRNIEIQDERGIARIAERRGAELHALIALEDQPLQLIAAEVDSHVLLRRVFQRIGRHGQLVNRSRRALQRKLRAADQRLQQVRRLADDEQTKHGEAGHHQRGDEQRPEHALAKRDPRFRQRPPANQRDHGRRQQPAGQRRSGQGPDLIERLRCLSVRDVGQVEANRESQQDDRQHRDRQSPRARRIGQRADAWNHREQLEHAPNRRRQQQARGCSDAQNPDRDQPVDDRVRKLEAEAVEEVGEQQRRDERTHVKASDGPAIEEWVASPQELAEQGFYDAIRSLVLVGTW